MHFAGFAWGQARVRFCLKSETNIFTREEAVRSPAELEAEDVMSMKRIKIANQPCPCGSGKKYKKCHGRRASCRKRGEHRTAGSPSTVQRLRPVPANEAAPFIVERVNASRVPPEVIEKAQQHFAEFQRREQERISRFGDVRPEITGDFQGYKIIAIGNRLMYMPSHKCKFFTDVLLAYIPQLFGREWFEDEVARPRDTRHPVMQWRVNGMNYMNSQPALPDGSRYVEKATGHLLAYLTFAYDLYIVEHNARLDARLLERLKHAEQFQGARHELFAEATCLRAGFEIEHENEEDGSTRHVEFTATHKLTGQKISVEAKSKHRPGVLGQPGERQSEDSLNLPFGKLLNDAAAKDPSHPLAVFLDMNMPIKVGERFLVGGPHPFIPRTLDRMRKQHGGKAPINLLVITNHPYHYGGAEEVAPTAQLLTVLSGNPEKLVQYPDALQALHKAANLYGNIPQELSTDFK